MTTFHELLRTGFQQFGASTAILFEDQTLSYEELLTRSERVACGLQSLGITHADNVAIVMENSVECILAWLASSVVGCTEVPINPQYRSELLRYLLHDSGVTVVICDGDYLRQVIEIADRLPALRMLIVNGAVNESAPGNITCSGFEACAQARADPPVVTNAAERVILYTSGTTGPSKGVIHTQRSCLRLGRYNAEVLEYDSSDRLLNFFPLYHQNARYTGIIPALSVGASIRLERSFSSSAFWRTCDADGTTAFNYLGSVLRLIHNVTPAERVAGTHTLKKAFGAGAPPMIWEQFEQRLGVTLVETYGLSEAPMATINSGGAGRRSPIGSAGRASELFEVAIVNQQDEILESDEIGEIVVRPRCPDSMMLGYHNKDAATVLAYRNLWFHSGDRGRLSPEGDLYFEERSKDSIRRLGENISAWEVESVLDRHPDVAESAVYGIPSVDSDQEVIAALVLRSTSADLRSILDFAKGHLPRYAVPTQFKILPRLPRTPTEKVRKAELRAAGRIGCIKASDLGR